MPEDLHKAQKVQIALAIARGQSIAAWAQRNNLPRMEMCPASLSLRGQAPGASWRPDRSSRTARWASSPG